MAPISDESAHSNGNVGPPTRTVPSLSVRYKTANRAAVMASTIRPIDSKRAVFFLPDIVLMALATIKMHAITTAAVITRRSAAPSLSKPGMLHNWKNVQGEYVG